MARPVKSAKLIAPYNRTLEETKQRIEVEETLKGRNDDLKAPDYLTESQQQIFNNILSNLEDADILGNLDIYLLEQASICIDRLQKYEEKINKDIRYSYEPNFIKARNSYAKDFQRYCNELSLSPQSRAKIGNLNLLQRKEEKDPILKLLGGAG